MKPRGRQSIETSSHARFVERADVKQELTAIKSSLETLNDAFSHPSLNGSVLFGVDSDEDPHRPLAVAGVIGLVNAEEIETHRLLFNRNILQGRKIDLGAAAIERCSKEGAALFDISKMNAEENFVFSYPLFNETKTSVIGVAQQAYYYLEHDLPDENWLHKTANEQQETYASLTGSLSNLQAIETDLLTALELAPPVTPNRFAIRWDITNVNLLLTTNYGAYARYLQHAKRVVKEVVAAHCPTATLAHIDDQNIIIEFPKYIARDPNDALEVRVFQNREIAKLSTLIQEAHVGVAEAYKNAFVPNLRPNVVTNYGNGFFEDDGDGKLTSPLLYAIQRKNLGN
ncbi:MAG: hypothetical protein WAQ27_04115 [Candidatus Microsaccharimonas sp.]